MALDNMKVTAESFAGKTTIIMADIIASNRVIHIVDSVLRLPIEIRQRINILQLFFFFEIYESKIISCLITGFLNVPAKKNMIFSFVNW